MPKTKLGPGRPKTLVVSYSRQALKPSEICPQCELTKKDHPRCSACGALCGSGHEDNLFEHRGHLVCEHCRAYLKKRPAMNWTRFIQGEVKPDKPKGKRVRKRTSRKR